MKHVPLNLTARPSVRTADPRRSLVLRRALGALLLGGAAVMAVSQAPRAFAADASAPDASAPMTGAHPGHRGHDRAERRGGHMNGHMNGHMPGHGLPFAGRGFERLLDEVKATDAQRQQIRQIAAKAQGDLQALHQEGRDAHHRGMAAWTSPKLDAGEAEKLRQQMLAHHDRVSKRVMQAMLEVGQVLSPEQRAQAARIVEKHHAHRGERHGMARGSAQPPAERSTAAAAPAGDRNERIRDHMLRRPVAPASTPAAVTPSAPAPAASSR